MATCCRAVEAPSVSRSPTRIRGISWKTYDETSESAEEADREIHEPRPSDRRRCRVGGGDVGGPHRSGHCPDWAGRSRYRPGRPVRFREDVDLRVRADRVLQRDLRVRGRCDLVRAGAPLGAAHPRLLGLLRLASRPGRHEPPLRARRRHAGDPGGRAAARRRILRRVARGGAADPRLLRRPTHRDRGRER